MVKKIKLLALDIDGVLTDGRTTPGARAPEKKRLAFQDLDAINAARRAGLEIALVTGESDGSVDMVAARTGVAIVRRGAKDKLAALEALAAELRIALAEICYVGDGDRDAPALARVGLAFAPANGTFAARSAVHRILHKSGGHGAVNEAVRLLLSLRAEADREKIIRRELRAIFKRQKIPHRHLPAAAQRAQELAGVVQSGRKILLCGEQAESAFAALFAGNWDWPAVALSRQRAVLAKQVRALARPGDWVAGVGAAKNAAGLARILAMAEKQGAAAGLILSDEMRVLGAAAAAAEKFLREA